MIVLAYNQVECLVRARRNGLHVTTTSLDLGLTTSEVRLEADRVVLPGGQWLSWERIAAIHQNETACFVVENNGIRKIQFFSEYLNRVYTLMPTSRAPTMLVSGIPMHRIKGINPYHDTLEKIKSIKPVLGRVLDTTMGLGYTAIEAAKTAGHVITIELDPTVVEVCRLNPWSQALFDNPRIERIIGDVYEEVENFADATFARIIHDPPTFSLAGDLYSEAFYRQLFRILQRNGRLFHYIGNLKSKSGSSVARGVVRRLQAAGFERVVPRPQAFGVVGYK